ncbi:hypothetical protein AVEN_152152-1 [Araneus ventricosus]|uniref:Uncharacterized protein n=1 Tax=Araneus ventricosus TaxID=182803 RepID=A0A4Y2HKL0_ARAVE|nr:hypothetical protein AVEN_152152-1 [Araneus ventricosus]
MKKKTASHDHREKYSNFKEKNSAHDTGATKEPKLGNFEKYSSSKIEDSFDRKTKVKYYNCSSREHIHLNCQLLKQSEGSASLNQVINVTDNYPRSPYKFIGEAQQLFDEAPICLTLAEVELKEDFGQIITKAAVVWSQADKGRYLLGNRIAVLLKKYGDCLLLHQVNAIQTRAQKRITDQEKATSQLENTNSEEIKTIETGLKDDTNLEKDNFSFPRAELGFERLSLMKVDRNSLVSKQKECETFGGKIVL